LSPAVPKPSLRRPIFLRLRERMEHPTDGAQANRPGFGGAACHGGTLVVRGEGFREGASRAGDGISRGGISRWDLEVEVLGRGAGG
jgi:hypothetical protein